MRTRFFRFPPKIHVFDKQLDTLSATRADVILTFRDFKSVF